MLGWSLAFTWAIHIGIMNFEAFFNGWLIRQENFTYQLLNAITSENEQHQALIDQVLSHYEQYYVKKSVAVNEDVFLFISPPWFTSFERTFLWIGGFRPSLIFRLITNSVEDLTAEQQRGVQQVRAETRREESKLGESMARVQESVGSEPLMNLARCNAGNSVDGEVPAAIKELENRMVAVLAAADALRGTAVKKVVEIFDPIQTVKLLGAAAEFHLRIRRWGLEREKEIMEAATTTPEVPAPV